MQKISLASYTIRVRKSHDSQYLELSEFIENADFIDFLESYLKSIIKKYSHHEDDQRLLKVTKYEYNGDRIITGTIESGIYGYTSHMYDVVNRVDSYVRKIGDAELLPFFFLIEIPKKGDEGIVILERFGNLGIRKALMDDMHLAFTSCYREYLIEINPLVPERLFKEYLNKGKVTKVRFRKFITNGDIADQYCAEDHEESINTMDLVFTSKRNHSLPFQSMINKAKNDKYDVRELIELNNFKYDTVQVEMTYNGEKRTIDLSNTSKIRAYFDVTDKVTINKRTGHPVYESIAKESFKLLEDLKKAIKRG